MNLADAIQTIGNNLENSVSMYAVIKPNEKEELPTLRFIEVEGEGVKDFDRETYEKGFARYQGDEYPILPPGQAYETKGAIAKIPQDYYESSQQYSKTDETRSTLARFLNDIDSQADIEQMGDQVNLTASDTSRMQGIVFRYAVGGCVIYAYQQVNNLSVLQSSRLLFPDSAKKFKLYTKQSIKIDSRFDFIVFEHCVYCIKLNVLERQFGFQKVFQDKATQTVDKLACLISDSKSHVRNQVLAGDMTLIRKLVRASDSPVLSLSPAIVKQRAQKVELYRKGIRFDKNDRMLIEYKKDINIVVKLLNDDILRSPITEAIYDSKSKLQIDDAEDES